MRWKYTLIGLAPAVLISLLCVLGVFANPENLIYDIYLRFRRDREPAQDVVFLDIDDDAVAYNGFFPWPRSITADALLRLKEYGARAAVFDIEYIDKGPQGVDSVYLNRGLAADFDRSFSEINARTRELIDAVRFNRISRNAVDGNVKTLSDFINNEKNELYSRAKNIARDNDLYLIHASQLFGKSWVTLNLHALPLSGEYAERRAMAEKRFSHPVSESPGAIKGNYADVLPPLPGFALSAAGAGFTNLITDNDGKRRRIDLARNIRGRWYLQLVLSPLVDYLGNPSIELDKRAMYLRNARMPDGTVKDIKIPLDGNGRMLLDWPKTDYFGSYSHVSFADFSLIEELELELEHYTRTLGDTDITFFSESEPSLASMPLIITDLEKLFDVIRPAKADALKNFSDESFKTYADCRRISRGLMREILNMDLEVKMNTLIPELAKSYPDKAGAIREGGERISGIAESLRVNLDRYEALSDKIGNAVSGKFCIMGRADTGTTDTGPNPFYGEYADAGIHGVVLDTILSGSFINPAGVYWQAFLSLIIITLFFIAGSRLSPAARGLSGFVIIVIVTGLTLLLFRFTGIFFSPLAAVFSMVPAVILREITGLYGLYRIGTKPPWDNGDGARNMTEK